MKGRGVAVARAAFAVLLAGGLVAGALSIKAFDLYTTKTPTETARIVMKSTVTGPSATAPGVDAACLLATRASEKEFSVLACGDILLARTPGKRASEFGPAFLFEGVQELVSSADIAFANLESPVSSIGAPFPGKQQNITFRADPAALQGISWAGFDILSLANNHMNDYGPRAVSETLRLIDSMGIGRCGAGMDLEEARKPAIIVRDGVRFAFIAFTDPIWSVIGAKGSLAGTALSRAEERLHGPFPPARTPSNPDSPWKGGAGVAIATEADIVADIRRIKATLAPDYLFVSIHWGDEQRHIPNAAQKALGHAAIDAGATAVLGHHPHVLQSIERYKDGLIAYSLGNFVFDMSASRTYETAALRLVVSGGRLRRADVVPLLIGRMSYAPALLPPAAAKSRLEDVLLWSSRLGTKLLIDGSTGSVFF
ncbi:MAG: hypothetical protein CVV51_11585 [Spirochaetae bacterium HGW-Spirochaetae-7]|nr:MAG: hypothetical protein CVV51_11585 [Spirochaetae bacterium HGW-Spirochaetae-7]